MQNKAKGLEVPGCAHTSLQPVSPNNTQRRLLVSLKTPTRYCVEQYSCLHYLRRAPSLLKCSVPICSLPSHRTLPSFKQAGDLPDPDTTSYPIQQTFALRCSGPIS